MKIYFAVNFTRAEDIALYRRLFVLLENYGEVLTAIFGHNPEDRYEEHLTAEQMLEKDMALLTAADVVVAEVTHASVGLGLEIGRAREIGKKILCVFRPEPGRHLSPMIAGADNGTSFIVKTYTTEEEADGIFKEFLLDQMKPFWHRFFTP